MLSKHYFKGEPQLQGCDQKAHRQSARKGVLYKQVSNHMVKINTGVLSVGHASAQQWLSVCEDKFSIFTA